MRTTTTASLALAITAAALIAPTSAAARPPDWVGTVLAAGRLERPAGLCAHRGGVGRTSVTTMDGRPLERIRDTDGVWWATRERTVAVARYYGDPRYISFQRRPFIVAAWCERRRPPKVGLVIIQPDGTPVVVREDGTREELYPEASR